MQWRIRHACRVERMSVHKASRVFEVDRKTVRKMLSGIVTLTAVWPVCGSRGQSLCDGRHLPPLSHRVTAELAKRPAGNQVALDVEEIVDGSVDGEELLGRLWQFEALHLSLSSSYRLMGVFGSIVLP